MKKEFPYYKILATFKACKRRSFYSDYGPSEKALPCKPGKKGAQSELAQTIKFSGSGIKEEFIAGKKKVNVQWSIINARLSLLEKWPTSVPPLAVSAFLDIVYWLAKAKRLERTDGYYTGFCEGHEVTIIQEIKGIFDIAWKPKGSAKTAAHATVVLKTSNFSARVYEFGVRYGGILNIYFGSDRKYLLLRSGRNEFLGQYIYPENFWEKACPLYGYKSWDHIRQVCGRRNSRKLLRGVRLLLKPLLDQTPDVIDTTVLYRIHDP